MAKGFRTTGQAEITKINRYKPADSDITYHSLSLGFIGGEIKANCSGEQAGTVKEGDSVDFVGALSSKDGKPRLDLVQVGPVGSILKRAA
jgi:hypothetical protein